MDETLHDQYLKLHEENKEMLLKIVDGHVDKENPVPITLPEASCLIARVIDGEAKMLVLIKELYNQG